MVGRIPILQVMPVVDLGRQAAKATVGEPMPVSATVFREGHDRLGAEVVATDPSGTRRPPIPLVKHPERPDFYEASVTPDAVGAWTFEVQAWSDPIGTWQHAAGLKIPAGVDVDLMFTEGRLLLEKVRAELTDARDQEIVEGAIAAAEDADRPVEARLAALQSPELTRLLAAHPIRELVTIEGPYPMFADRQRALFGSWYEFFPRSEGATEDPKTGKVTSGTFRTALKRLDYVADLGFDVIYLPPIHPIGEVNRKGPNNTLTPGPDDTGSPWAIGSKDGGHDAIHPDLGTMADFDAFVARAGELGLEVALDLALQAAPDHPWVQTNPEWFTTRADGSIAYAENPPKKYQDIYPVNFDNDPTGICREVLRILKQWMSHGVRIFRVDNPHTKPVAFWEWLLREIRRTDPGRAVPGRGVHPSGDDEHARRDRVPPVLHLLHLAHRQVGDRGLPARALPPHRPPDAAELLRQHPRHPPRVPPVRRPGGVQDPRGAGGDRLAELGRLRRLRALRARRGQTRERGVPRLREVPDPGPRLGDRRGRGPHARAVPARAQRRPAGPPGPPAAAQRHHPQQPTTRACWCSPSRPATTSSSSSSTSTRTGPGRRPCTSTCRRSGWAGTTRSPCVDEITQHTWTWGENNYVRLDPGVEPAHILSVRKP